MDFRQLKHRITIQKPALSGDGMGGGTQTWTDIATVWGNVTTTTPSNTLNVEEWTSDQFRMTRYYIVILRYRGGITTDMRLMHRGRILEILSVVDINERNWACKLYCREGG